MSKITNQCFKVLSVNRAGTFYSASDNLPKKVKYPRSRWVYPFFDGTPLFAFEDSKSAIDFVYLYDVPGYHTVVYRAEHWGLFKFQNIMLRCGSLSCESMIKFWSDPNSELHYGLATSPPRGTILITGIRLVEKIFDNDRLRD
jgi:hypothetical protein